MICIFQQSCSQHVAKRVSQWKLTDIKEIKTYGKQLISCGPLTDVRSDDVLRQTENFKKFLLVQIRVRINYERLLRKQSTKKLNISRLYIHLLLRHGAIFLVSILSWIFV